MRPVFGLQPLNEIRVAVELDHLGISEKVANSIRSGRERASEDGD